MKDRDVLYDKTLLSFIEGKSCLVYGAGKDGQEFYSLAKDKTKVIGFIDGFKTGEIFGLPIVKLDLIDLSDEKPTIIIASSKYEYEMAEELEIRGMVFEKDFYIWHKSNQTDLNNNFIDFVEWNKRAWNCYKGDCSNRRVLVACMDEDVYPRYLLYGHLCEYLCNRFCARADAYITFKNDYNFGYNQNVYDGFYFDSVCSYTKEIYKSFGIEEFLYPNLSEHQSAKAVSLVEEIWNGIKTWEDWKNITVYGICFGTTIIRCMMRFFVPCFNPCDIKMKRFLARCIENIVFWWDRFEEYDYKAVLMRDGVTYDGFIRDIALAKGIEAVNVHLTGINALSTDYCRGKCATLFREFWEELSDQEKTSGLKFGKAILNSRLKDLEGAATQRILNGKKEKILTGSSKTKVLICPHMFCEDQYFHGENLFHNNTFEWLCFLGEISNKTNYDWYIKMHPHAETSYRDIRIINNLIKKYPRIKLIPTHVSPYQLKEEGLQYVLTVYGTVGSEYPALGIKVITAGDNPFEGFKFTINPKSINEYRKLLLNLENDDFKINVQDMYKFWAVYYGFYNWKEFFPHIFIDKQLAEMADELYASRPVVIKYDILKKELNGDYQDFRRTIIEGIWEKALSYDYRVFYKNKELLNHTG